MIPWRRKWQHTLVVLPGRSHGQRNLAGYSPWGCRVGHDWAFERIRVYFHTCIYTYTNIYQRHVIINVRIIVLIYTHMHTPYSVWKKKSESLSVMSDSLWPHGLYSPWDSPGQNTGVGSLSFLQGIFPTQGLNPASCMAVEFFTSWATREAQEYWSGEPFLLWQI